VNDEGAKAPSMWCGNARSRSRGAKGEESGECAAFSGKFVKFYMQICTFLCFLASFGEGEKMLSPRILLGNRDRHFSMANGGTVLK